jgi:CSLREA domain-containing protein
MKRTLVLAAICVSIVIVGTSSANAAISSAFTTNRTADVLQVNSGASPCTTCTLRVAGPQLPTGIDVHVDTTADAYSGVGCSLRDAIQTINSGANHGGCTHVNNLTSFDRVLLPSGTYSLTLSGTNEDFNVTGDLDIRRSMIISATGATSPTVTADPGWDDRIFDVVTGTVTIKGLVISGGAVTGEGGGIRIESGTSLTLGDSTVISNTATGSNDGGGISNDGTFTLVNSTISGNTGKYGSGVYNGPSASLMLTDSTIRRNNMDGVDNNGGLLTLNDSTVAENAGTGIINNGGPLTATNTTVSGNNYDGIDNVYGTADLTNVTLSGNTTSLNNQQGVAELRSVTINGNSAYGIYENGSSYTETVILANTIIANSSLNCATTSIPIISNGYNLSSDGSCAPYLNQSSDLNTTNPHLGPLQDNGGSTSTHALLIGSPAIDAIPFGANGCGTTLTTDQRGVTRPIHGKCDIGAYEVDYFEVFLPLIQR